MHQRLEDAIDAGLGDLGLLIDVFQGDGSMVLLQLLDHVKSLGENGDQIKPFNLSLRQSFASLSSILVQQLLHRAVCLCKERAVAAGEKLSPHRTPGSRERSREMA
jgi:hypothetical protein